MWTLAPGFLLSPFYKDTRVVILSERATRASEGPAFRPGDLGRQGAVSRRRERAAHNPVLITLEQTDACDYRCRCSRCAVGVGVWKFDESRELLRQQRSERQYQHNQLE